MSIPVCVGYCRVSTQEQAVSGYSLEAQKTALAKIYQERYADWPFQLLVDDGVSAFKVPLLKRPAGRNILKLPKGSVVLVTSFDRAWRNVKDYLHCREVLEACQIKLEVANAPFPTEGAIGKLVTTVLAAVAEWESNIRSERTRAGLQKKRQLRGRIREEPTGWVRQGNVLIPDKAYIASWLVQCILKRMGWHVEWIKGAMNATYSFYAGLQCVAPYWTDRRTEHLRNLVTEYEQAGVLEGVYHPHELPYSFSPEEVKKTLPPPGMLAGYFWSDMFQLHILCFASDGTAWMDGVKIEGKYRFRGMEWDPVDLLLFSRCRIGQRLEQLGPLGWGAGYAPPTKRVGIPKK